MGRGGGGSGGEVGGEAAKEAVDDAEERRGTDKNQWGLEEGDSGGRRKRASARWEGRRRKRPLTMQKRGGNSYGSRSFFLSLDRGEKPEKGVFLALIFLHFPPLLASGCFWRERGERDVGGFREKGLLLEREGRESEVWGFREKGEV
ncbi:uncharacterized protein A4U43_UnF11760 [Asparagus officinalis]|uniref:Uncharacterized protein n=1 Tax=Asparagus officinalis TaxID=4686 RepID=A0A1R3L576_ASPOF|nr:uncharacterized protein A4U43_UnF11760 [Asparagus officinalis]